MFAIVAAVLLSCALAWADTPATQPTARVLSWWPSTSPYAVNAPQLLAGDGVDVGEADWLAPQLLAMQRDRGVSWLIVNSADVPLFAHPDDALAGGKMSVWHPNGIARATAQYGAFFARLAALGVHLTYVAFDGEMPPSCWQGNYDPAALAADPRYAQVRRTDGFPADPTADGMTFNAACARRANREFATIGDALTRYHPGCQWSNYGDTPVRQADAAAVPEFNAHAAWYDPSNAPCYSPVWYGSSNLLTKAVVGGGAVKAGDYVQGWTAPGGRPLNSFERVVWSLNALSAAQRADASARFRCWTTGATWCGFSPAHRVETRIDALLAGDGVLLHWRGDDLTPDGTAADDDQLTQAGQAYDAIVSKSPPVALVPHAIQRDDGYFVVFAVRCADGSYHGRVTWADKAKAGVSYGVDVAPGVKVTVKCGTDAGTSF